MVVGRAAVYIYIYYIILIIYISIDFIHDNSPFWDYHGSPVVPVASSASSSVASGASDGAQDAVQLAAELRQLLAEICHGSWGHCTGNGEMEKMWTYTLW
jgi:hypothetical protein